MQRNKAKDLTALVIDEEQSLSTELMEEVRLLANLETLTETLLPVVMAGQPELADMLDRPELRHLKQRVALRADLAPLGVRQVAACIAGRLRKACGGDPLTILTKGAIMLIYKVSGGISRTISVACENAMLAGFASNVKPIGAGIVEEVSRDFLLRQTAGATPAGGNGTGHPRDKAGGPWQRKTGVQNSQTIHPAGRPQAAKTRR